MYKIFSVEFSSVLKILAHGNIDTNSYVLDFINTSDDILKSLNIDIPSKFKQALFDLANHLTFEQEFATFIEHSGIDRELLIQSCQWCLGAIISKSNLCG